MPPRRRTIYREGLISEMPSMNKVLIMGHLTRDVDLRSTQQGKHVAEMTLALNRRNGDREEVCFADVVVWGKTAENCKRYLEKGSCAYVEGYLRQERWEDRQTGQRRSKLRIMAESVQFISNPRNAPTRATEPNQAKSRGVPEEYAPPPREGEAWTQPPAAEDDIPF